MSVTAEIREQVRTRAGFACEYCGVTETDSAGELTVDHFYPQVLGGADTLENLIYCCPRCNQHKGDYWPQQADSLALWNPRQEPCETHFVELADGTLYPVTPTGSFTIARLRLNRAPLVAYRIQRRQRAEEARLLARHRDLIAALEQVSNQHAALLEERRALLAEQRRVLLFLLQRPE
jgi:hypothetical protein